MRSAECGTSKAFSRKDAKACLFSGFDRQAVKESNRGGREEKQFLAILALPVRVCSQADLERALAIGRETTRNAELGMRNEKREKRTSRDEYARRSESWIPGLCSVAACLPRFALKVYWQFLATLACLSER